jgi:hypothetical protein
MSLEEPVHPAPRAQPEPLVASSSQVTPPSDAVMSALERITGQLQTMDARWSEQFHSIDTKLTVHF